MNSAAILPATLRFFHTGDLGDIIASLPCVRHLNGGEFIIGDVPMRRGLGRRETMKGARYEAIKPLLEAQPYIHRVTWEEFPKIVTHDFSTMRLSPRFAAQTLAQWQASYLKLQGVDYSPWLTVEPNPVAAGRVIVARSPRYHEKGFPWMDILDRIGGRALFVGLPSEHKAFEEEMGCMVEKAPTETLLDVARLIAGADLTIVNQTSTFWIAAALGAPLVQETFRGVTDSVVQRDNARYPMNPFDYVRILASLEGVAAA